jgi:hypothetical protein
LAGLRRLSKGRHPGGPSPGGRGEGIRAAPWLRLRMPKQKRTGCPCFA